MADRPLRVPLLLAVAVGLLFAAFACSATSALAADPTIAYESEPEYTSAVVNVGIDDPVEIQILATYISVNPESEGWTMIGSGGYHEGQPFAPGHNTVSEEFTGLKPDTTYKVKVEIYHSDESFFETPAPYPTFTTKHVESPVVTFDPVSAITPTTAHFAGTVNANAPAGSLTANQEGAYETSWHFECEPSCAGASSGTVAPGEAGYRANEAGVHVTFDATGLESNTAYQVKLVATNAGGSKEPVAEQTFSTSLVAPTVTAAQGSTDGESGYVLEAIVNPRGSSITDCHFAYGPVLPYTYQAPCSPTPVGRTEVQVLSYNTNVDEGQSRLTFRGQETGDIDVGANAATVEAALKGLSTIGPDGIASVTAPEEPGQTFVSGPFTVTFAGPLAETNVPKIGFKPGTDPLRRSTSGGGGIGEVITTTPTEGGNSHPITVEAHLTGLTPGATYHFQVLATNAGGTGSSGDRIFVPTQEPAHPECANETLRQENNSLKLSECRAYEMVSAPNKDGRPAYPTGMYEGASIGYLTGAGNINGSGQGGALKNLYVANRNEDGWKTASNLNGPDGSLFAGPQKIELVSILPGTYSADLQKSLWGFEPESLRYYHPRLWIRNPDGTFTRVDGAPEPLTYLSSLASSDLSHVVFNSVPQVLYEFVGTEVTQPRRVDVDNSGQPLGSCPAAANAISNDGSVIVFTESGGCSAPVDEIWARVNGAASVDVSASKCNRSAGDPGGACNAPSNPIFVASSGNGSRVVFTTEQQLVNADTNQTTDIYSCVVPTDGPVQGKASNSCEHLVMVSGGSSDANVNDVLAVSRDGSTVFFRASGVLADNQDARETVAQPGADNLYLWRQDAGHPEGETTYLGALETNDIAEYRERPQLTNDGRFLVFNTAQSLTPTDTDIARDVYRYDANTEDLSRVTVNSTGTGGNGTSNALINSYITDGGGGFDVQAKGTNTHLSVSEDGKVVFMTEEALSPADSNEALDTYMWSGDRTSLITTGAVGAMANSPGGLVSAVINTAFIDPSGHDVYFTTSQPLTWEDGDEVTDVYDARVLGGFKPPKATVCDPESSCQPPPPPPPSGPAPGTTTPTEGNVKPKTCAKGKTLRKDRCVKKKRPKKHRGKKDKHGARHGGSK